MGHILSHHGITGWMAPDDINPGQPFDKAIVDQVRQSDLIILLFCEQSDQSRHVKRELMMAEDADKLIETCRAANVTQPERILRNFVERFGRG